MNKTCGRSAAGSMIAVSIAIRLIWHFSITDNSAYNAAWICPLIGILLFLPVGFAIKVLSRDACGQAFKSPVFRDKAPIRYVFSVLFFLLLSIDAGVNTLLLSNTANVMALGEVPVWLVSIPFALLAFVSACLGMQAEGRSATIWIRIMIALAAVMIVVQFQNYRPEWLTLVFGGGIKALFSGSLTSAAYMSLLALPWLLCTEDRCHRNVSRFVILGAVCASAVLLLLAMLAPPMVKTSFSKSARLELVLSNGRVHLLLQLITVALWFTSLLHLLGTEAASAAAYFMCVTPRYSKFISAGFTAACAYIVSATGILANGQTAYFFRRLLYPFICLLMIIAVSLTYAAKRRGENASRH